MATPVLRVASERYSGPRLSRRRERAETEEDDEGASTHAEAPAGDSRNDPPGSSISAPARHRGDASDAAKLATHSGGRARHQDEPARKRRRKRSSSQHASAGAAILLLGEGTGPTAWVVEGRQSAERKAQQRRLAQGGTHPAGAAADGLTTAMEAEGVDRQFADMLTEYLSMDVSRADDASKSSDPSSSTSAAPLSSRAPHRAPLERIIPGIRPLPAAPTRVGGSRALPSDMLAYRDAAVAGAAHDDARSDASSDWQDEDERADESDGSSIIDGDREGEDEDSNSEGFYRNDYPEGEGQDDDFNADWNSEEDEDEDDDASDQASDQYAGESE